MLDGDDDNGRLSLIEFFMKLGKDIISKYITKELYKYRSIHSDPDLKVSR